MSQELLTAVERLQLDIKAIEARNQRVEAEKAWERSLLRISMLCSIIYACSAVLLCFLGSKNCVLDAFVPVLGFYLSSQSLPVLKQWYVSRFNRDHYQING